MTIAHQRGQQPDSGSVHNAGRLSSPSLVLMTLRNPEELLVFCFLPVKKSAVMEALGMQKS